MLIYVVILAVVSLLPSGKASLDGSLLDGWDAALSPSLQNLLHLPAYAVFVCLVLIALAKSTKPPSAWPIGLSVAACFAYGVLLECLQAAGIPGRTGSLSDVLVNTAGIAVGIVAWVLFGRFWRRAEPGLQR